MRQGLKCPNKGQKLIKNFFLSSKIFFVIVKKKEIVIVLVIVLFVIVKKKKFSLSYSFFVTVKTFFLSYSKTGFFH